MVWIIIIIDNGITRGGQGMTDRDIDDQNKNIDPTTTEIRVGLLYKIVF